MHLAVYCDYSYRIQDGRLYAELPFGLFLEQMAHDCDRLTLTGRFDPTPGRFPYELSGVGFVGLPHYASGVDPRALARSMPGAVARYWRMLSDVDVAWVLGPTPVALLFAVLTLLRGRRLALGVRQDLPRLFAARYPDRPLLRWGAGILEGAFRLLARRCPVVVVGPDLARRYRRGRAVHNLVVSVLREDEIMPAAADGRCYDAAELRILSVGRLDPEKNPLLLADILAGAVRRDPRWRMDVCGEGPLAEALERRFYELGVGDRATLHGLVPVDGGLLDLYRDSHALLHVSLTEGVPQVILEAFALRLPVVGTAVGGVPDLVRGAGLLVSPSDAGAAVDALEQLAGDAELRARLVAAGVQRARTHSLEAESARVVSFLAESMR
ncbi:MAG TPA: glycosyltransferase family 4 protein [Solirubrobacteraceae bacterium]|nr:glycosyltransferase family 4 protein [Solirubrobacteraceae bacterium]